MKTLVTTFLIAVFIVILSSFANKAVNANIQQDEKPITLAEFNKRINNKEKIVVVYFSANWCAVCLKMKPVLANMENKFSDKVDLFRVDTDRDKEITNEFEIDALPVLILYRNGVREWIYVGVIEESVLDAKIRSYANYSSN